MKKIVVASKNPVKKLATEVGFRKIFPDEEFEIVGIAVASGVNDQPMTQLETLQGAINRVHNARDAMPDADFHIGIEGGIQPVGDELQVLAWVVILSQGKMGKAQTGIFYLPQEVATLIHEGYELGHADDKVFGRENSKQGSGSIGILTNDVLDRTEYYVQAVMMALVPFINPNLTWKQL
jgi:inosine/xanthosine triphosphatase